MARQSQQSYIDTETILSPSFSPTTFANRLVTSTNNASDTVVDLSTPLSRVLFDVQEIDSTLHTLSTASAQPLLEHARTQTTSAARVLVDLEAHIARLTSRYSQLDEDVVQRHAIAEEVRLAASRLWVTVKIGRAVQRALLLGRQLDANMEETMRLGAIKERGGASDGKGSSGAGGSGRGDAGSEEAAALLRAANSILSIKALLSASGPSEEGEHLARINVVATLRTDLLAPAETKLRQRAQQIVREFSLSSVSTDSGAGSSSFSTATPVSTTASTSAPLATINFAQSAATRTRTSAALQVLYLLSPPPASNKLATFTPTLMLSACEAYLRASLTASSSSLGRALAALSTLPRVLAEVSARCQNVAALEKLMSGVRCPEHALLIKEHSMADAEKTKRGAPVGSTTLLHPLLDNLDTSSLPSYFWRSLAPDVGSRVADLMGRGGVGARQLRSGKERLKENLREAVLKGCEGARPDPLAPAALRDPNKTFIAAGAWEREVGVMVGSVLGPMGR